MSLQEKVLKLKLEAVVAARHAAFWEKAILTHGEEKATAFYKHLGLNHLDESKHITLMLGERSHVSEVIRASTQMKSIEWEGLALSREPNEAEKICVKGIAQAQESSKEQISTVLLALRTELIDQGLKTIKKLTPASYHKLILIPSDESRQELRSRLLKVYKRGRSLVAAELSKKEAVPEDEFELLDDLVDLTDSRVANEIQARIASAAARYRLLGLGSAALWKAVEDEVQAGSVSYIDRAAQGVANSVINIGRSDEADERSDEWERVEYSAILDQNVCGPCAADDGQEASSEDELTPTPNPECEGGDWCRCFHVFVAEGNM